MFKKLSDVPITELPECVGLWAEKGPIFGIISHICTSRGLVWFYDPKEKWDEECAHPLDGVVLRPDVGIRAWNSDGTPVSPR